MVRAMDRNHTSATRTLLCLVAVGGMVLAQTGCSQLQQFVPGRSTRPAAVGDGGAAGADPYLAHHTAAVPQGETGPVGRNAPGAPEAGPERSVIRSTAHPVSRTLPSSPESDDPAPAGEIRLGAPVSLPTAGPATPDPAAESRSSTPVGSMERARDLIARSKATLASMTTYQVQIHRQERVGGVLQPAEDLLLSIRHEPRAIRLEWPAGPHKGREVIYSTGDPSGMLHVHMGDSLVPVPKLSLPPDSPMVAKASRHPITEAGFETVLAHLEKSFSVAGDGDKVAFGGVETPGSVGRPCHKFLRTTPTGEGWLVYLDVATTLPALVRESSATGDLLELDLFHDVRPNVDELSSPDAFDPSKRWGSGPLGLFGRGSRTPGPSSPPSDAPLQR